ncbi:hypothetical protein N7462_011721 [Penicillium macrosclerotiorum]|uniref:uncharacterized protein n=1 Tax=Penicillium macrosclerotiorum TaxID=303699 RepID=UPI002546D401|nr:uncharacterized protein N7462_011721 [Penicillium macrosclerotiorum]KAJ5662795.1 hypothetical protein N7462_011721 [Penicillium macrosclerotiorum]
MPEPTPFNLTALDRQLLAMTDEEFVAHDWDDLKAIIGTSSPTRLQFFPPLNHPRPQFCLFFSPSLIHAARNDLGALKRRPSDLRRYLTWTANTKAQYGSIMNFICQQRLKWHFPNADPNAATNGTTASTLTTSISNGASSAAIQAPSGPLVTFKNPRPFADPEDYRILRNDWPYGLSPGISHLVVWLRTPIPVKSAEGHLTDESRALIESFVQRTFVARLAKDTQGRFPDPESHVLWFKNWVGLQSVRALEHVHILVRDVPDEILTEWSGESGEAKTSSV